MSLLAPLAVAGLGQLVGTAINGVAGGLSNASAQRRAYEYQLNFWKQQNEYNLPINQRRRLEAAGYNVNSLGAAGISAGNSSSGLPSLPSGAPSVTGSLSLSDAAQAQLASTAAKKNEAEADKASAEAERAREQTNTEKTVQEMNKSIETLNQLIGTNKKIEAELLRLQELFDRRTLDTRVSITEANLTNVQRHNQLLSEQTNLVIEQCIGQMNDNSIFGIRREQAQAELAQIKMQTFLIEVQARLVQHNIVLTDEQIKEVQARASLAWQQSIDLQYKSGSGYWNSMSSSLSTQADLNRRQYHWMPVMNAARLVDTASGAVGTALQFVTKRLVPNSVLSSILRSSRGGSKLGYGYSY